MIVVYCPGQGCIQLISIKKKFGSNSVTKAVAFFEEYKQYRITESEKLLLRFFAQNMILSCSKPADKTCFFFVL